MELYTVIYNGVNLYAYTMTQEEKTILEDFRKELMDICDSLDVPRGRCGNGSPYMGRLKDNCDFVIKYKEDIGFFALGGERGRFSLMDGFPEKEREQAKFILLNHEFWWGGLQYELGLREQLEKEWAGKYLGEYDSRKAGFEYTIKMLKTVFMSFPEEVISEYAAYMNKWFDTEHWYFDKESMTFEEIN